MFRLLDHIDLRVANIAKVKPLYDALMHAYGLRAVRTEEKSVVYLRLKDRKAHEAFVLNEESDHRPNGTRIAFGAESAADVDRIAARIAPFAHAYEAPHACKEYTETYYAAFFEDAEGNKLEICFR